MNPQLLPAALRDDVPGWAQTVVAFLSEKERRSGSRRTVEGYARMLWPFLDRVGSPDRVTPAHVLAWVHGIGASGREPSSATVGARIACLSSYFRFLIRMNVAASNPCDALERPRTVQSVARDFIECAQLGRFMGPMLSMIAATLPGRRRRRVRRRSRESSTIARVLAIHYLSRPGGGERTLEHAAELYRAALEVALTRNRQAGRRRPRGWRTLPDGWRAERSRVLAELREDCGPL